MNDEDKPARPDVFESHKAEEPGLGHAIISYKGSKILGDYLRGHEIDIAFGVNDFGDLEELFIEFVGRSPSPKL